MKSNHREAAEITNLKSAPRASCRSRREFLRTLGMAGAGAMLSAAGWAGQTPAMGRPIGSRINMHHHANPPIYVKTTGRFTTWNWAPAASIEQMEKYDVSTSLVKLPSRESGSAMRSRRKVWRGPAMNTWRKW